MVNENGFRCIFCNRKEFVYNPEKDLMECPCGSVARTIVVEPTLTHKIGSQEHFGTRKKKNENR